MQYYFQLQIRRLSRLIRHIGLPPAVGYVILVAGFAGLSWALLRRGDTGAYAIAGLGLLSVLMLGQRKRIQLVKEWFGKDAFAVRLIENILVVLPFVLALLAGRYLLLPAGLIVAALVALAVPPWGGMSYVVPTPFGKWPYEFPSGFRVLFPLFVATYILFGIGLWVGNMNLSAFAIAVIYLVSIQFYSRPEPLYYVWIYKSNPTAFIGAKSLHILICSTILAIVPAVVFVSLSPGDWWLILLIMIAGPLLIIATMLAKYAYYPHEVNIAAALGIGFCIFLPVFLPVVILTFFLKARENLLRFLA